MDVDEVVRYRVLSERYLVITPSDRCSVVRSLDDVRALAKLMPMVRFSLTSQMGMQIERYMRRIDVRSPNRLELDNADALTSLVAGGIGWAITSPMCVLQGAGHADRVAVHVVQELSLERSLYLVARRGEYDAFFESACETARQVVTTSFLPRLGPVREHLEQLIVVGEKTHARS